MLWIHTLQRSTLCLRATNGRLKNRELSLLRHIADVNLCKVLTFVLLYSAVAQTLEAMNCSLSDSLREAAQKSHSAARGFNKIAFKVMYEGQPYILKTVDLKDVYAAMGSNTKGGFNRKATSEELVPWFPPKKRKRSFREGLLKQKAQILLKHSSYWGLPRLFGYCFTETFSWILLEDAYGSLVDLPFPLNPSCRQLDRLMYSLVRFLDLSHKFPLNNLAPYQFGVTRDWRIVIVDLDILVDPSPPKEKKCKKNKDCDAPKHHNVKLCRKSSCLGGFCRYTEESHYRSCFLILKIFPWLAKYYDLDLPHDIENLQDVPSLNQLSDILKVHSHNKCSADIGLS